MSKFVQKRKYFQVICGTPYYVARQTKDTHSTAAARLLPGLLPTSAVLLMLSLQPR